MNAILFRPLLKEIVWGGHALAPYKGLDDPRPIGESWEISALPESPSVVDGGPYAGCTLTELVERFGARLLGQGVARRYGNAFPLLFKFIDAAADLSVQVHPDDALAHRRHHSRGKTEMWYVLGTTQPDASLACGFSTPLPRDRYALSVGDGSFCHYLHHYRVARGDAFFIPAGRVHAIGKGCLVAEIQQSSDITYRIFDYNRPGLDGRPRQLHTAEAAEAIDFSVGTPSRVNLPVQSPFFHTDRLPLSGPAWRRLAAMDSFVAYMCLRGDCLVQTTDADGVTASSLLRQGHSALVPAEAASCILLSPLASECELLEVYVPPVDGDRS